MEGISLQKLSKHLAKRLYQHYRESSSSPQSAVHLNLKQPITPLRTVKVKVFLRQLDSVNKE